MRKGVSLGFAEFSAKLNKNTAGADSGEFRKDKIHDDHIWH
jgi:hypothetical protein